LRRRSRRCAIAFEAELVEDAGEGIEHVGAVVDDEDAAGRGVGRFVVAVAFDRLGRDLDRERRALAELALHLHAAAEVIGQRADDRQADAGAFAAPLGARDDPIGRQKRRQHRRGNAGAVSETVKRSRRAAGS